MLLLSTYAQSSIQFYSSYLVKTFDIGYIFQIHGSQVIWKEPKL